MKNLLSLFVVAMMSPACHAQDLHLNDREYFERQGVNVLVFSNNFNGGFNDEKNSRQFKGFKTYDDRGTDRFIDPLLIETGHQITLATDQPERMVTVSSDAELKLYDGRILAQNEGTIAGNTQYVIFGSSFKNIVAQH